MKEHVKHRDIVADDQFEPTAWFQMCRKPAIRQVHCSTGSLQYSAGGTIFAVGLV